MWIIRNHILWRYPRLTKDVQADGILLLIVTVVYGNIVIYYSRHYYLIIYPVQCQSWWETTEANECHIISTRNIYYLAPEIKFIWRPHLLYVIWRPKFKLSRAPTYYLAPPHIIWRPHLSVVSCARDNKSGAR